MVPSKDPRYTKAKRQYNKASAALDGALKFLQTHYAEDMSDEFETFDAVLLLEKLHKELNRELAVVEKAVGVSVYTPYGRQR